MHENNVKKLTELVLREDRSCRNQDAFTAAISGIDASGKGFVSNLLQSELEKQDLKIANINIDPRQNPISLWLQMENPAENFYEKVFRWDDFFTELITPLKKTEVFTLSQCFSAPTLMNIIAIAHNSENLSEGQLVHEYNTYYYPAQQYHFQQDNPQKSSDIIYCNDELLGTVGQLTVNSLGEV